MSVFESRELDFAWPVRARSLLTVRAAISSARSSERPWRRSLFLMCSYWRASFVPFFTPRGGICLLPRSETVVLRSTFPAPCDQNASGDGETEHVAGRIAHGRVLERVAVLLDPRQHTAAFCLVVKHDRRMAERGRPDRRRRRARALPGVRAEMMVVAAGSEERGLHAELCHQAEAENVAVERDRLRYRAYLQVHVAHHRPAGEPVERRRLRIVQLAEEAADVEGHRRQ